MKVYDLKIDFSNYSSNRNSLIKNIFFNEQDVNTAFVDATLCNNGEVINLSNYNQVLVAIRKNDDTKVMQNCVVTNAEKGEINIPFSIQSLKSIGVNNFQIFLKGEGIQQMVSPKFYYNVDEALIGDDDVESSSEYPTLVLLISQTEDLIKKNNALTEEVNALNNAITANEEIRQRQETERQSQEQGRQTSIVNMQNQVDTKLEEIQGQVNTKLEEVQGQVDTTLTEKIKEVDVKITEVGTAKDNMISQVNNKITEVDTAKTTMVNQVNAKITEVDTAKTTMVNQVNTKIEEFTVSTNANTKKIDDKIVDIQNQLNTKTTEKFAEVDETLETKVSTKFTEVDATIREKLNVVETQETARQGAEIIRQTKEGERQTSIVNMKKQVDDKIVEFEGKFNDMANSNVAGEVTLARISKDGTEHGNLSERLNYDYDELLKSIGTGNEDPTKISSFYKVLTMNDWVLGEDGFYTVDIAHPLKSEDLIITAIDSTTKDSYDLAHKVLSGDSVRIISTSASNCNLSILSTKSQTIDVSGLDLSNYATKEDTYNKNEIDDKIANVNVDIDLSPYARKDGATFTGIVVNERNGEVQKMMPSTENNACYYSFYKNRTNRSGYFGYESSHNNDFVLANESTNANINFKTNGSGKVKINGSDIPTINDDANNSDNTWSGQKLNEVITAINSQLGTNRSKLINELNLIVDLLV